MKKPDLAVFWGDTRRLLTKRERTAVLQDAVLESLNQSEVLLRDRSSNRLIVVTSAVKDQVLYCSLCEDDLIHTRYGQPCPGFAQCLLGKRHLGDTEPERS